jgi:hypothetical protein
MEKRKAPAGSRREGSEMNKQEQVNANLIVLLRTPEPLLMTDAVEGSARESQDDPGPSVSPERPAEGATVEDGESTTLLAIPVDRPMALQDVLDACGVDGVPASECTEAFLHLRCRSTLTVLLSAPLFRYGEWWVVA